jgi:hypothetical protein
MTDGTLIRLPLRYWLFRTRSGRSRAAMITNLIQDAQRQ